MAEWSSRLLEKDELDHKQRMEQQRDSLRRSRFAYLANFLGLGPKIATAEHLSLDEVIKLAGKVESWPKRGLIREYVGNIEEFRIGIKRQTEYDLPSGKFYYALGCVAVDNSLLLLARYNVVFDNPEGSLDKIYSYAKKSFEENILHVEENETKVKQAVEKARELLR